MRKGRTFPFPAPGAAPQQETPALRPASGNRDSSVRLRLEEPHLHAGELDHVVVRELARLAADGGAVDQRDSC